MANRDTDNKILALFTIEMQQLFTARVRGTMGRYCFHRCLSGHGGGGGGYPGMGYPAGYPTHRLGYLPGQVRLNSPPARSGCCTPLPRSGWGTSLAGMGHPMAGMGYPLARSSWGTPKPGQDGYPPNQVRLGYSPPPPPSWDGVT